MSFYILDSRNNGYPCIYELQDIPDTDMKIPYPHGVFMCMGEYNDGYPFIPEINNVGLKTYSSLYFGENNVSELYFNGEYITKAYCNEQEVFSVKYTAV